MAVLCQELYDVLHRWGGEVLVAAPGENASIVEVNGKKHVHHSGETYRVCCRFCNDTRHRLYVNHTWYENRGLAHCFNETECLRDYDTRRLFEQEILNQLAGRTPRKPDYVDPEAEDPIVSADPPGHVVRLAEAPHTHPAYQYAVGRGFDPDYLTRTFDVGVCLQPSGSQVMRDRLYIPVFDGTRMAGWQGRYPGDPPPDPATGKPNWKQLGLTKYYNRPGFRKSRYLYGPAPWAELTLPFVVLVEGVTDAWRVGPAARAYCGIELSVHQRLRVVQRWGRTGQVVVCMGDGSAHEKNEHQAMLLTHETAHLGGLVVKVNLPAGVDPGSLSYEENWDRIEHATAAAGCPVRRPSTRELP